MKKLFSFAGILFGAMLMFAQVPQKMSYQAVVRNASGQLLQNKNISSKISILQNSESGTVVYSERLTGSTNANGLISFTIGSGTILSGDFSTIDWSSGNYYLKTETDPEGGTNYSIAGTSQLLSVPYSLYSKNSGDGFTLPFSGSFSTDSPLFDLANDSGAGIRVSTKGIGVFSTSSDNIGVWGTSNSFSGAGILGDNVGGGEAVAGRANSDIAGAVVGRNNGGGSGVRGFIALNTSGNAVGVLGQVGQNGSTGMAAKFENLNSSNYINVFVVESNSTANLAVFKKSGSNVARINAVGKGFFNGGTQNSGADIAEAFDVEGSTDHYEPGDILIISTKKDRSVEKSSEPYSILVAGVYATKPGVLLTEENIDSNLEGKVPMGVIGVIPTKVCLEGGAIKRGDLLVTSSLSGVAMKADSDKVKVGQVLGKALQDFNENGIGKIKVLISIK